MAPHWWQTGIIYHIYPRSFQDSNGDGIGDLAGITRRLDYLRWLGVDALWISPIYPSPMADFGYDVSDYTNIHPMFGSLEEMDQLLAEAHARQLRVLLDFVPNHSSDQHPWFLESRTSRDNPKREWYMWRDPAPDGGPPNNWLSRFGGGPAWKWDETTQQYYLHTFLAEQPDFNWRNPQLREAMADVLRFWLDRGVDGFRVDVSYRVMKYPELPDNPPNPNWQAGMDPYRKLIEIYNKDTPFVNDFNRWIRQVVDAYDDRLLIGEINLPLAKLVRYYGDGDEFHLPQNLNLHDTPWTAADVRALVEEYEGLLPPGGWPNWVLGNHDQHRVFSRIGADQGRLALFLLLTLRGTPIIYYGDEIGMHDVEIPPDKVQDPWELKAPGLGLGRDPERSPMQWSDAPNAGFAPPEAEPWLPVAPDFTIRNVALQQMQPGSELAMVKALISLRRATPALNRGEFASLDTPEGLFAFIRSHAQEEVLVVANFNEREVSWALPEAFANGRLAFSSHMERPETEPVGTSLSLRPHEGVIITQGA